NRCSLRPRHHARSSARSAPIPIPCWPIPRSEPSWRKWATWPRVLRPRSLESCSGRKSPDGARSSSQWASHSTNHWRSIRLDVRLPNNAAELVILFAKKRGEVSAANPGGIEALGDELRLAFRDLHGRRKPAGEFRDCFVRRLRRREQAVPIV